VQGQERRGAGDDGLEIIIPLIQPLKNVEDKVAVKDHAVEVAEGVSHALHLAKVVTHWEVALDEFAECCIEVNHARFTVADQLVLDHEQDLVHGNAALLGDVLKLAVDRAKDLGDDDALHTLPRRVVDGRNNGDHGRWCRSASGWAKPNGTSRRSL
jgi:hypothetical protein